MYLLLTICLTGGTPLEANHTGGKSETRLGFGVTLTTGELSNQIYTMWFRFLASVSLLPLTSGLYIWSEMETLHVHFETGGVFKSSGRM